MIDHGSWQCHGCESTDQHCRRNHEDQRCERCHPDTGLIEQIMRHFYYIIERGSWAGVSGDNLDWCWHVSTMTISIGEVITFKIDKERNIICLAQISWLWRHVLCASKWCLLFHVHGDAPLISIVCAGDAWFTNWSFVCGLQSAPGVTWDTDSTHGDGAPELITVVGAEVTLWCQVTQLMCDNVWCHSRHTGTEHCPLQSQVSTVLTMMTLFYAWSSSCAIFILQSQTLSYHCFEGMRLQTEILIFSLGFHEWDHFQLYLISGPI